MKLNVLVNKYNSANLVLRIAISIVVGALLGALLPSQKWISEFGVLFVGALKAVAPVLVFILIICSLAIGNAHPRERPRLSKSRYGAPGSHYYIY